MDDDSELDSKEKRSSIKCSEDLINFGFYTTLVCIFVELAMLTQLSNTMFMVYAGYKPEITFCGSERFEKESMTECEFYHKCIKDNGTLDYNRQFGGIVEEFDLFCEKSSIEKLGTSLQMVGLMIGCLVFGQLGESYGRRRPMLLCLLMCSIFGFLSSFANSFVVFTIFRTILSFFNGGQSTISVVYLIENVPKKSRMYISTLISFSPNVIIFGFIAFTFQYWRTLSSVVAILNIPPLILLICLKESPRWLMQKGKVNSATNTILKIRNMNGNSNSDDNLFIESLLTNEYNAYASNARKDHNFSHLFSSKNIFIGTFVIAFSFFSASVINYANMFNLGSISGSIYFNSILIGVLRYSVSIVCGFFDYNFIWFKRKTAHGLCSIISILALSTNLLITVTGTEEAFAAVIRYCVLLSCTMTSQAIIVASVTSNEIMPTAVRSLSYSIAQLSSRFGMVFAPHVFHMAHYSSGLLMDLLPYAMLLTLSITDLLLFRILLPESKNKPLEDHINKNEDNRQNVRSEQCQLHPLIKQ